MEIEVNKPFLRYNFSKPDPQRTDIILTCRSGRRVLVADRRMKRLGYQHLRIYSGSFRDWAKRGGKVIRGDFEPDYETLQ